MCDDAVLDDAEVPGYVGGGLKLDFVALAVVEGERVAGEAVADGDAEGSGGIESSAQEADGFHVLTACMSYRSVARFKRAQRARSARYETCSCSRSAPFCAIQKATGAE